MQIKCFLVSLRQNYKSNIKHKERSLYESSCRIKELIKRQEDTSIC